MAFKKEEDTSPLAFSPLQQHREEEEYVPEQPTIFLAMGSPTLMIERSEAHDFLREMGRRFHFPERRPVCVVCVSARWVSDSDKVKVMSNPYPKTVHDFFGFAECLNEVEYAATCDVEMSAKVAEALEEEGIPWEFDGQRGYDFGCWAPMALLFPSADIPLVQVSLHASLDPELHCRLGAALGVLRESNFLIVCSGGVTHNLMDISFGEEAIPPSAITFDQWVHEVLRYEENRSELQTPEQAWDARNRRLARWQEIDEGVFLAAKHCHPTPEHFIPLFVASGSGGSSSVLHHSWSLGCLSMAAFMFGQLPPMLDLKGRLPAAAEAEPGGGKSVTAAVGNTPVVPFRAPLALVGSEGPAASGGGGVGASILGSGSGSAEDALPVGAGAAGAGLVESFLVSQARPPRRATASDAAAGFASEPATGRRGSGELQVEDGGPGTGTGTGTARGGMSVRSERAAAPDKIERPRTSSSVGSRSSRPASRAMVRHAQDSAAETDERKFVAMIELSEKGQFSHKARENDREL